MQRSTHVNNHIHAIRAAIHRVRRKNAECKCIDCKLDDLELQLLISIEELLRFGATDVSLEGILAGIKNEMQSALNAMLFDEIDTGLQFRSSDGESFTYTEKPGEAVRQFGSIAKTDCETYKIWIDTARTLVASGHDG